MTKIKKKRALILDEPYLKIECDESAHYYRYPDYDETVKMACGCSKIGIARRRGKNAAG